MADLEKFFSKFQLVKVRSRKLTIIMLIVAIVLSIGALTYLHLSIRALKTGTGNLRDQAAQLEQENSQLEDKIDKQGTEEGTKDIAREELGLEDPDTVIFVPEN